MLQALKLDKVSRFAKDLSVLFICSVLKTKITGPLRNKMFRNRPVIMYLMNVLSAIIKNSRTHYNNAYKHILSANR